MKWFTYNYWPFRCNLSILENGYQDLIVLIHAPFAYSRVFKSSTLLVPLAIRFVFCYLYGFPNFISSNLF